MIINERLKNLRKAAGFTQSEIAEKINIKRETYTRYETGTITPPADMILLLAKILTCTTDYLLGASNDPQSPQRQFSAISALPLLEETDNPTPPDKTNAIPPEKLRLLDNIGYAYYGAADKELDEEDVDKILELVEINRKMSEKRDKK